MMCRVSVDESARSLLMLYTSSDTAKEPYHLSKEPYHLSKEPYYLSKEPYHLSEEPCNM